MQAKILSVGKAVGTDFDDCMIDRISRIKIQHNKAVITGIGIVYDSGVYKQHNLCEYSLSKFYYAVYEEEYVINDDYLQQIVGSHDGQNISSLKFVTYNGNQSPLYGTMKGQQFDISCYGDTFSSVNGSFDRIGLTSIGFKCQPLNIKDLERFNNIKGNLQFGFHYPTNYQPIFIQYFNYPSE